MPWFKLKEDLPGGGYPGANYVPGKKFEGDASFRSWPHLFEELPPPERKMPETIVGAIAMLLSDHDGGKDDLELWLSWFDRVFEIRSAEKLHGIQIVKTDDMRNSEEPHTP